MERSCHIPIPHLRRALFLGVLVTLSVGAGCGGSEGAAPDGATPDGAAPDGAIPDGGDPVVFDGEGWIPCSLRGDVCAFERATTSTVRVLYGNSPDEGQYNTEISSTATSVPCVDATFGGNPNPIAWEEAFCWYWGPIATSTPIAAPTNPAIDLPLVTPTYPGATGPRVRPGAGPGDPGGPTPADVGAFREICGLSHYSFDDPIVYPGQAGRAHLHMFFGNTDIGPDTTAASAKAQGASTCAGGTLNRSAYWTPALIDTLTDGVVRPVSINAYYKSGYQGIAPGSIAAVPEGLVMISGDAHNTTPGGNRARYMCDDENGSAFLPWQSTIPDGCPANGVLFMEIIFPQCWDGVHLDSADHRSHMAFGTPGQGCPASHPVPIPEISYQVRFRIPTSTSTNHWQLSSDHYDVDALGAGLSGHADYMYGWDNDTVTTFMTHCVNAGMDCHNYLLGDGTELY